MLDMLPTERIGRATWLLAQGRTMTVRGWRRCWRLRRGARAMLERLSRVVPLVDDGGVWRGQHGEDTERWLSGDRAAAAGGDG